MEGVLVITTKENSRTETNVVLHWADRDTHQVILSQLESLDYIWVESRSRHDRSIRQDVPGSSCDARI